MKTIFFVCWACLSPILVGAQTKDTSVAANDQVFQVVEQMPEFEGGQSALMKFLGSHTVYPKTCVDNEIMGTVYVQFVVNREGDVVDAKVVKHVNKDLEAEAVRVVASMPKWKPGKQNGKLVSVYYTVPLRFKLDNTPTIDDYANIDKLMEQDKLKDALDAADALVKKYDRGSAKIYVIRARIYLKMHKDAKACDDLKIAQRRNSIEAATLAEEHCK